MIDALKPHPAYRPSAEQWLGDVPQHWEVRPLKYTFSRIVGGSTPSSANREYWDGDVVWVTPPDVARSESLTTSARKLTGEGFRSSATAMVPAGSIVVTTRAPVGNVAVAAVELCTNQGCKALVPGSSVESRFAFYVLKTLKHELQSLAVGTTFTEISMATLASVRMPLPPLQEQAAIVRFLDHADRLIRRYIAAKQKLIKLLEEERQAVIQRAVTQSLDGGAPLKPSGVGWLGDVPQHWDVVPLGRLARIGNGSTPSRSNLAYWQGGGYPWLNSSKVNRSPIVQSDQHVTDVALRECHLPRVAPGSVLVAITGQGKTRGKAAVLAFEATINQHIAFITPTSSTVLTEFLHGSLVAAYPELRRLSDGSGSTKGALTCGDLAHFRVAVPPLEEQESIVSKVKVAADRVEAGLEATRSEIVLLQELRTRLIADVVTGKLDVRESVASLPESAEDVDELADDLLSNGDAGAEVPDAPMDEVVA